MNDQQLPSSRESKANLCDLGQNGAMQPNETESLSAAISEILHDEWVQKDPTADCFDFDDDRTDRLLKFLDKKAPADMAADVKSHLVECPRCRFIYSTLRKRADGQGLHATNGVATRTEGSQSLVPEILRSNLRCHDSVVFPDGHVSVGAWEFGRLKDLPSEVSEAVCDTIADHAWRKLRLLLPREGIMLVCFGHPIHQCGMRLASRMVDAGMADVHVVMADDYFVPRLWCNPEEFRNRHVVIMVDVVRTGCLMNRLCASCRDTEATGLIGLAVVDQSRNADLNERLYSLWAETPELRRQFKKELHGDARYFDPSIGLSRSRDELPSEVANLRMACNTVEANLHAIEPLSPYIEATEALRQDAVIGGVCYPWVLDLLRLLGHDEARAELAKRARMSLADLAKQGTWCLVYPAERSKRAGAWAKLLGGIMGWPVVKIGLTTRRDFRPLTEEQKRQLRGAGRVVIVDAAIRTGKTLESLAAVLRQNGPSPIQEIVAFYAFDGLFNESRRELRSNLNIEIRSLFRLPLGAPTNPVKRHCRDRLIRTMNELQRLNDSGPPGWVEIVRSYCLRKLARTQHRPAAKHPGNVQATLRRALDEGERGALARLEHSCDSPKATHVKHLDVEFALAEPRTRNILHGFLCNSMKSDFIEWCALALATQKDFEWLTADWLKLHKRLFTNAASPRWEFLACVAYWIRQNGNEEQVRRVREAVSQFKRTHSQSSVPLFPDYVDESELPQSLDSRCSTLISVLS